MPTIAAAVLCLVVGVADGDTLTMRCDDQTVKVRLAEIDAPEKRQPWGTRSRQALADLCFQQQATLRAQKLDRYGRTVGRVECSGKDASHIQVATGMAWAYRRYLTDAAILRAENAAMAAHVGLWSDMSPLAPWEWRRR
ncbi:thermonuclease family protein [Aquincola tertiaricarbonis]|uniref:Thermonuclease family protein n=1 Tax=Aquincola tertiaricarbonis TaxID=391953 RepID=A0ABY4SCK5_AQUTE|nr:thermonuclease family protein [Aquincola tertiaricarbonis]URI11063.1 thermonuclease family protein [Aquincola tertiaricarbonis]